MSFLKHNEVCGQRKRPPSETILKVMIAIIRSIVSKNNYFIKTVRKHRERLRFRTTFTLQCRGFIMKHVYLGRLAGRFHVQRQSLSRSPLCLADVPNSQSGTFESDTPSRFAEFDSLQFLGPFPLGACNPQIASGQNRFAQICEIPFRI